MAKVKVAGQKWDYWNQMMPSKSDGGIKKTNLEGQSQYSFLSDIYQLPQGSVFEAANKLKISNIDTKSDVNEITSYLAKKGIGDKKKKDKDKDDGDDFTYKGDNLSDYDFDIPKFKDPKKSKKSIKFLESAKKILAGLNKYKKDQKLQAKMDEKADKAQKKTIASNLLMSKFAPEFKLSSTASKKVKAGTAAFKTNYAKNSLNYSGLNL